MSQWTASRSHEVARAQYQAQYPTQHSAQHPTQHAAHYPAQQRREPRSRGISEPAGRAYTIAHAGRQVRFGPVAFWIVVGTVVIMAGWSITAATYLTFRNDVLRTLIAHQADQQFAYEDRIAELRAEIDRTTSRQLLDQEQFEQKLDELMHRQAALELRSSALNNLADPTTTGSIGPVVKPGRDSPRPYGGRQSSVGATFDRMEASLDHIEQRQSIALAALENRYQDKARRIRSVLDQLGVRLVAPAVGGPFVPVKPPPASQGFQRAAFEVKFARSGADQ